MANYVPNTDSSLVALIERLKTNPSFERPSHSQSSEGAWQELLEPGPSLGMLGPSEVESLIAHR